MIKDIDFWRSWHGLVAKRSFAYDDGLRIPWIVRMPGYVPVKLRLLHQLAQAEMEREATRQPRVSGS